MKPHIVVLGAGPAGLSAAWQLALAGHQVTVIEKECRVGGLCQTVPFKNFRFDLGGHRFFSQNKDLVYKITDLMGDALSIRPRKSVIRLQNQYFKYPIDLPDLLAKLKPQTTLNCILGYGIQAIKNRLLEPSGATYEQWLVKRFGRPLYNLYFAPYSEKLWGTNVENLSSDWAAQRISKLSFTKVLKSILNGNKKTVRTFTKNFYYPVTGIGQISEKMAHIISNCGGRVLLNSEVMEVNLKKRPYTLKYRTSRGYQQLTADYIISTIPITDFARGVYPQLASPISERINQLKFRSLIFLNIMFDQPQVSENTWIYVPEKEFKIMRLQEPKNWHPANAPAQKTSIICEIACNFNDDVWQADKNQLYAQCIGELEELGFSGLREKTLDYFITYASHAYPVYFLGYREVIDEIIRYFDSFKNLILCGRQGLYRYNNMDHAIEMGMSAADVILEQAEKQKIYEIADDKVYLETNHVIKKNKKNILQA